MSYAFSLQQLSPIRMSDIRLIKIYQEKATELKALEHELKSLSQKTTLLNEEFNKLTTTTPPKQTSSDSISKLSEKYQQARLLDSMAEFNREFKATYGDAVLQRSSLDIKGNPRFSNDADYDSYLSLYSLYIHDFDGPSIDFSLIIKQKKTDDKIVLLENEIAKIKLLAENLKLKNAYYATSIDWEKYKATAYCSSFGSLLRKATSVLKLN